MRHTTDSTAGLAAVAEDAARRAGAYLMEQMGQARIVRPKSSKDDLLDIDLDVERIIIDYLQECTPQYGVLSEEAGRERPELADYWLVDPVDGSANYQHGIYLFGVNISLVLNAKTQIGVIYLPVTDEMFVAIAEHGAKLNQAPIHVSTTSDLNDAVIHFGDFSKLGDTRTNRKQIREMAILADQARRVRMVGSAAVDLAFVACGRADGLIIHGAEPWDIGAGMLLVQEAGGLISIGSRNSRREPGICSNAHLHDALRRAVASGTTKSRMV